MQIVLRQASGDCADGEEGFLSLAISWAANSSSDRRLRSSSQAKKAILGLLNVRDSKIAACNFSRANDLGQRGVCRGPCL
jgi:hypothetical protein